ncbi:hypothetical protein GL213_03865 [Halogeometricum borinquense]|uniref:Uncharacterized protein n=1 Tax=Halogeometricum borinquense (strain ATCC 700274 / DSM 11551 / JCM 10706 / KCTC 4070 / PR3) TaxID=469382 RepID=E4NNL7_HALBP|nr:DUF6338 family protein [Halogeometricum borinquense]ADQ66371.1 hypothetical protein Hbor_07740 [Halogeometricum borinquense DSM 11551]ELY31091.1 hypothetical protein C499_01405 [Halogeometricum borinquense DSM 11551]QIQ75734.1 hypothetical protein GL213_03865 [Halogeometricum borinquense]
MATPTTIPISVLSILLLLAPGLVGLQIFFKYAQRRPSPSRTKWVAWSALTSLISLVLLYLFSGFYLLNLRRIASSLSGFLGIISINGIELSATSALFLYLSHIFVIFVGSSLLGLFDRNILNKDEILDPREPWEYAFDEIPVDGEELDIYLQDGVQLRGEFNERAWDSSKRELFLENPYKVESDGKGGQSLSDLGRSILIQSKAVSHIVFATEDPDQKRIESIEVTSETAGEIENLINEVLTPDVTGYEDQEKRDNKQDDEEDAD